MPDDLRARADARLDEAAASRGYADPRPPLRDLLRDLKERHPAAFSTARQHFEQQVVPGLAAAADPLAEWVDYARFLASLTTAGRLLAVDATGLAAPYRVPEPGQLILFVPEDTAFPVVVAAAPADPSAAQRATLDLLVQRKLSL